MAATVSGSSAPVPRPPRGLRLGEKAPPPTGSEVAGSAGLLELLNAWPRAPRPFRTGRVRPVRRAPMLSPKAKSERSSDRTRLAVTGVLASDACKRDTSLGVTSAALRRPSAG
jgi:hypothetical protein